MGHFTPQFLETFYRDPLLGQGCHRPMSEDSMHNDKDCIFCQIIAGTAPAYIIHEDADTMTILDIFPVANGHSLILTKEHHRDIFSIAPATMAALGVQSKRLATVLEQELQPDGLGVYQLNGSAAGQTVFHYHMHLIPRKKGESIDIHSRRAGDPVILESLAERLKVRLND